MLLARYGRKMTNQVVQLVGSSPNFGFLVRPAQLPAHLVAIAGDAAGAEFYYHADLGVAMVLARRFSENLARLLMSRHGLKIPHSQDQRIKDMSKAGLIDSSIAGAFDLVRKVGNKAVHEGYDDRVVGLSVVKACRDICAWWHQRETGQAVTGAFVIPQQPPSEWRRLDGRFDDVKAQLNAMQTFLETALAQSTGANAARIIIVPAMSSGPEWSSGSNVDCGGMSFIVHDPVERVEASDGSWTLMQANAHRHDSSARRVRLRGVLVRARGDDADRLAGSVTEQAAFLKSARSTRGLPDVVVAHAGAVLHTLATAGPEGLTWRDTFGDEGRAVDPLLLPAVLAACADVAQALALIHGSGQAHRALDGTSLLVTKAGKRGVLRDLGWAWAPRVPGEGGTYRAPEQRTIASGRTGPATDVFQLASLLQHTCTGLHPGAGATLRLRVLLPEVPAELDELVARALDPDPRRRPSMASFAAVLRRNRTQASWSS
jgi:hypothetical protein